MPGFLGTEKSFSAQYSKPILEGHRRKAASAAGLLAMESLHRQVLPFVLGRRKDTVLKDLPPKIIQDLKCDLSPLQLRLYDRFERSQEVGRSQPAAAAAGSSKQPGALEALQVC